MSSSLATDIRWLFAALLDGMQMSHQRTMDDGTDMFMCVIPKKDGSHFTCNNILCARYEPGARSVTVNTKTPESIRNELYKCLKKNFVHIGTSTDRTELYFVDKLALSLHESHAMLEALL